jgi:hypothetical protein
MLSQQVVADTYQRTKQSVDTSKQDLFGTSINAVWTSLGSVIHTSYGNDDDDDDHDDDHDDDDKFGDWKEKFGDWKDKLGDWKNGDHKGNQTTSTPPTVTVYKVVINNQGNPTPSAESFGVTINGGIALSNGTKVTIEANKPSSLNEEGLTGYEFVEIWGDGHCPENLGGTITLDAGQNISCYIVNQPVDPSGPPQPGVIFHYNTLQFSFGDPSFGDSCSAPGKTPPCVELANANLDSSVLVVDSELKTDTTIVLFSVVESGKLDQNPPLFGTSPLCVLSGMGPHTTDYAQEPEIFPVTNPSNQLGFEFQCSLAEADNFNVSYALIETKQQS